MTREQKLSLIMGFALVLAVGVLLSDHLSGANRGQSASPEVMGDSTEIGRDYGEPPALSLDAMGQVAHASVRAGSEAVRGIAESDDFQGWVRNTHPTVQRDPVPSTDEGITPSPPAEVPTLVMGDDAREEERASRPAGGSGGGAAADSSGAKKYTVQKNDTLWGIAQQFYGDGSLHKKLATYNEGRTGKGGALYAGATLLIPPASELGGRVAQAPVARAAPAPRKERVRYYTVQKNDTLSQIAQRELGTVKRMDDILSLNSDKLDSADDPIWVGMKLKLPST